MRYVVTKDLTITEEKTVVYVFPEVSYLTDVSGVINEYDCDQVYLSMGMSLPNGYELYFRVNTKELVLYCANPHGQKVTLDVALYFDE